MACLDCIDERHAQVKHSVRLLKCFRCSQVSCTLLRCVPPPMECPLVLPSWEPCGPPSGSTTHPWTSPGQLSLSKCAVLLCLAVCACLLLLLLLITCLGLGPVHCAHCSYLCGCTQCLWLKGCMVLTRHILDIWCIVLIEYLDDSGTSSGLPPLSTWLVSS